MGLENLTGASVFIDDLVNTNPAAGDQKSEGDDHIRGIKNVLLNSFPGITGAVTSTQAELNILDGVTATAAELNVLDGIPAGLTATEIGYLDGVTSAIQTQIDAKINSADALPIVQVQTSADATVATGSTQMVTDDTIPQNTEGNEFLTVAITPTSATNKLIIKAVINIASSVGGNIVTALFQDATANALAATSTRIATANNIYQLYLEYEMAAGTTSSTTFKIRAGLDAAATVTFNGASGSRLFGGVSSSFIKVIEVTQ